MLCRGEGHGTPWCKAGLGYRPAPGTPLLEMLASLRGARLLQGFRGSAAVDLDALADVVVRIGTAALALAPAALALEVNPLLVDGTRIEALDAVVTWREHS